MRLPASVKPTLTLLVQGLEWDFPHVSFSKVVRPVILRKYSHFRDRGLRGWQVHIDQARDICEQLNIVDERMVRIYQKGHL
jgi:hypothetical protein